ncbi:hypothetical protein DCT98_26695 [Salmonella enterica]|nr:hypothetical protein [Salmonella enterica]
MAMRLSVRWKKDRKLQFRLALFTGGRSRDVTVADTGFPHVIHVRTLQVRTLRMVDTRGVRQQPLLHAVQL